jgi:hypothetical protein
VGFTPWLGSVSLCLVGKIRLVFLFSSLVCWLCYSVEPKTCVATAQNTSQSIPVSNRPQPRTPKTHCTLLLHIVLSHLHLEIATCWNVSALSCYMCEGLSSNPAAITCHPRGCEMCCCPNAQNARDMCRPVGQSYFGRQKWWCEAVVVTKQEEPQAIFHGKTVFCRGTMLPIVPFQLYITNIKYSYQLFK